MLNPIEMKYERVDCCCCGADNAEPLWSYNHVTRTRGHAWKFEVNNVICRECGHIYVSPVPSTGDLCKYYRDAWTPFDGQALDFSVDKRLQQISKYRNEESGGLFVEIGSNVRTQFHEKLLDIYERVVTVELNSQANSDYLSIDAANVANADIVTAYFVLEHVPGVSSFLAKCRQMLGNGGVLMLEVPDIAEYPTNISAQILHEHVNHFSTETIVGTVEGCGFECIDVSTDKCSRSYGLVATFKKSERIPTICRLNNYERNRDLFLAGLKIIEQYRCDLYEVWRRIEEHSNSGKKSIIWCANENLLRMLDGNASIPDNCKVFDSNEEKARYLGHTDVFTADGNGQHIKESDYIVILSNAHADAILGRLEKDYNKSFKEVSVVDYYVS